MARISYCGLVVVVLLLGATPSDATEMVPYGPMRVQTVRMLCRAIESIRAGRDSVEKDVVVLELIALADWPRVASLRYVHIELANPNQFSSEASGWLLTEKGDSVSWLTIGLEEVSVRKIHIRKITPADFRSDVARLVRGKETYRTAHDRKINLLYTAYLSADLGLEKDARECLEEFFRAELVGPFGLDMDGVGWLKNVVVWHELEAAMFAFCSSRHSFGHACVDDDKESRTRFLEKCKRIKTFRGSKYDDLLSSLIGPLEQEQNSLAPSYLSKKVSEMSRCESIQYWIYQLRDFSAQPWGERGDAHIFSWCGEAPTPADRIVAAGVDAIPMLIEALEDATPTRTLVYDRFRRDSWEPLRRQDIAFQCLERIVGCRFYAALEKETFVTECPEARASVLAHVRNWWKISQGNPQAKMVRNYLASIEENRTLRHTGVWAHETDSWGDERLNALRTLANLEGPEAVLDSVAKIAEQPLFDEPTLREWLDPRASVAVAQIALAVAALEHGSTELRRRVLPTLAKERYYRIQRALLHALETEADAATRLQILRVLQHRPMPWHLDGLTKVLADDSDLTNRIKAGEIIRVIVEKKSQSQPYYRLENRDRALAVARQLLCDQRNPFELRYVAFAILATWNSFVDTALLEPFRANPEFALREVKRHPLPDEKRPDEVLKTLTQGLQSGDQEIRLLATKALGELRTASAATPLPKALDGASGPVAGLCAPNQLPTNDIDLYTATLFHERLAAVCREYGLEAGYGGYLACGGWPLGVRLGCDRTQSLTWHAIGTNREEVAEGIDLIVFSVDISRERGSRDIAACKVNGKPLYIRVEYVHGDRTVDDPVPVWALSEKTKTSGITVRKLLRSLQERPALEGEFDKKREDAAAIGLHAINLLHHTLSEVADGPGPLLCVYYRGSLGRHPTFGRGGICLPKTSNPTLTWSITSLDDTEREWQHPVCEIAVSLTKQPKSVPISLGEGSTVYLNASRIAGCGRTWDDKISELSRDEKTKVSVREFLEKVGRELKQRW